MNREKSIKSNRFWVLVWGIFFAIIAFLIFASLFSQRQEKTGENSEAVHISSLTCTADDYLYPFLVFDNANKKDFRIVVSFEGEKIKSASLQQMLYYDDSDLIKQSEGENRAAMNMSFSENGLDPDALDANYAKLKDGIKISFYGSFERDGKTGMKYFLLDESKEYNINSAKQSYEALGMNCESKTNNTDK